MDGSPCYVGKGQGKRWKRHLTNAHNPRLAALVRESGGDLPLVKVRVGLTDEQAKQVEVALIRAIGRGHRGPLVNFTDGGEGTIGWRQPDSVKEAVSRAQTGRKHSIEARRRMRESQTGRRHPESVKQKIGAKHKGKKIAPDHLAKMTAGHAGKPLTAEHRAKIGAAGRGRKQSPDWVARRIQSSAVTKYVNALASYCGGVYKSRGAQHYG